MGIGIHKSSLKGRHHLRNLFQFFLSYKVLLFMLILAAGIVPIAIFSTAHNSILHSAAIKNEISQVQIRAVMLSDDLSGYDSLADAKRGGLYLQYSKYASMNAMRIRIVDPSMQVVMDTYEQETGKYLVNPRVLKAFSSWSAASTDMNSKTIETAVPVESADGSHLGIFVISEDVSQIDMGLASIGPSTIIIFLTVSLLILTFAFWVVRIVDRKEKKLLSILDEMAAGQTTLRLREGKFKESRRFARVFNEILDNSSTLDRTREEFVSNVSHELKTPMTSMKVLADSLNSAGDVPNAMYKEFMSDITKEIDRENKIIEDLLSLVRMDQPKLALNITLVNLNDLIETTLKRLAPLADKRSIDILFESYRTVEAEVDEIKITQIVTNLVENAIKYGVENGEVRVILNADYQYFFLKVSDNGIGIPRSMQSHVFERFYRVDKTRSRETGGTGLGLAIVRSIVLMHHGIIKLYSGTEEEVGENHGSLFTVRIPLKYSDSGAVTNMAKNKGTDEAASEDAIGTGATGADADETGAGDGEPGGSNAVKKETRPDGSEPPAPSEEGGHAHFTDRKETDK